MVDRNIEKKEKSRAEFIAIIAMVAILMAIFILYILPQKQRLTNAGFTSLAQNFNSNIIAVHALWLMDKQPEIVQVSSLNKQEKQNVPVNKKGWVDVSDSTQACEKIWQLVMLTPLNLMKYNISVLELRENKKNEPLFHHCRYILSSGEFFDYDSLNGKVTKVIVVTDQAGNRHSRGVLSGIQA